MDPPPPPPPLSSAAPTTTTTAAITTQPYADSIDSSPRSRHTDSWDDPPTNGAAAAALSSKLRLMCSYGGHIVPRPHDKSLCYVGGETRIIVVDRNVTLSSLMSRLSQSLLNGGSFSLKYQLPSEDLDSLISVTTDEDLENMIEEYERTTSNYQKPCRLRLFLFQQKLESSQSVLETKTIKSDEWFLNALNGAAGVVLNRGFSDSASVNCLLGLDDEIVAADAAAVSGGAGSGGGMVKKVQDVHSVPDSPMMETTSSFGSSSSSPSLANLPPIRVHVEESGKVQEQFGQMNISGGSGGGQKLQQEEGFVVMSSPHPPPVVTTAATVGLVSGEYVNRVVSDDERSDHGVPVGFKKAPPPPQPLPQKSSGGGGGGVVLDLPSPDSISSDSSLTNAISRQKPMIYQDSVVQIPSGGNRVAVNVNPVDPTPNVSDPSARVHVQQIQDPGSGYVFQSQLDQQQQQQQLQQQPQQLQQQQLPQQQQFVHAGGHYIHHHPAGAMPISAYYPARGLICLFVMLSTAFTMIIYCGFPSAIVLRLLSIHYSRKLASFFFGAWLALWPFLFEKINKTKVVFCGETVPAKERVLLIANHRTEVDWMYLWDFAWRKGCHGYIKYILKSSLMKIPVFGWGFHIMEFISVERKWEVDESNMHKMLSTFKDPRDPLWLAIFPEGTDFTEQKCIRSQKYAAENGLPILKNVLLPKTKGFCACLEDLRGSLDAVYDLTIGYKHRCPTFLDNVFGVDPSEVHIHVQRIPTVDMPTSEEKVSTWLMNKFQLKDKLLSDFYSQGHFPRQGTEAELSTAKCLVNFMAVIALTITTTYFTFFSSIWFKVYVFLSCTYLGFATYFNVRPKPVLGLVKAMFSRKLSQH